MCELLEIKTPLSLASARGKVDNEGPTERLIRITKNLQGKTYLSGKGGFNYQDEGEFAKAGIVLEATRFAHPLYPQMWGEFALGLSALDVLFNCGEQAGSLIGCE